MTIAQKQRFRLPQVSCCSVGAVSWGSFIVFRAESCKSRHVKNALVGTPERGEVFYGAKMLSDATLSSWIGGSQCSDKVITASKRFLFIIMRYQFRYRVG